MSGEPSPPLVPERTRVKICGLRLATQARRCVDLGATHIGCVATPGLPRSATIDEMRGVAEQVQDLAHAVVVFVKPATSDVLRVCTETAIYHVQPHGVDEAFCRFLELEGLVVYRVHAIDRQQPKLPRLSTPPSLLQPALYDAGGLDDAGPCPWTRLQVVPPPFVFLRGAITPENLPLVLQRRPWGIDVTAGVERQPGYVDELRLARLFAALRQARAG
ncbi:MAG: hypothetical protein IPK26_20200 [Planctomycetes bacterium]|nr:hypothetical protein [Planctomycetota bacterium]